VNCEDVRIGWSEIVVIWKHEVHMVEWRKK
jgi:hypothetical protein